MVPSVHEFIYPKRQIGANARKPLIWVPSLHRLGSGSLVGAKKYPVLDEAFLPKLIEQCDTEELRGMVYILYYSGMHGSMLRKITESSLIREGVRFYMEWQRPKTNKTMRAQVPLAKVIPITAFLKSKKKSMRFYNYLLEDLGKRAGFEGISTMTFRSTRCLRMIKLEKRTLPEVCQELGCTMDVAMRAYSKLREDQLAREWDVDAHPEG